MAVTVNVRGIPSLPDITEVNVRPGPTTVGEIAFKVTVGSQTNIVHDVQPDSAGNAHEGKVYQWFKLEFPGGHVGWVRDDLLEFQGDLTQFGYPVAENMVFAFALTRGEAPSTANAPQTVSVSFSDPQPQEATPQPAAQPAEPTPATQPATTTAPAAGGEFPDALADLERVKRASFAITAAFEGTGYAAYNNYDAGIVSYGLIQFTLGAGSLATVLKYYLNNSQSDTAKSLSNYMEAVNNRDPNLRNDVNFKNLLIAAAAEQEMQDAQDQVATEGYWARVVDGYITHRGLKLPTTWALLFDMGVNFGVNHVLVRMAEDELGVPRRSKPGENGVTEEQLITKVAELRKRSHDNQAARDNLPGLRVRGDFWMNLINKGDWYLQGENGTVNVNGRIINVKS